MPVINRLVALYERHGLTVATGLNPCHLDGFAYAPFTWLLRDGEPVTNGLGIALQEVYFLECLVEALRPERIFVIGNSWGWSTLALALLAPEAKVVAIDAGFDVNTLDGLDFTNRVIAEEGLNAVAVKAVSPGDVAAVAAEHFEGPVDFAFVDGLHTDDQIFKDFEAVRAIAAADPVLLFHDVHDAGMVRGFARVRDAWPGRSRLLAATPSGMGVLYTDAIPEAALRTLDTFGPDEASLAVVRKERWRRRHRHLYRWGRSLAKRGLRVPALLGEAE